MLIQLLRRFPVSGYVMAGLTTPMPHWISLEKWLGDRNKCAVVRAGFGRVFLRMSVGVGFGKIDDRVCSPMFWDRVHMYDGVGGVVVAGGLRGFGGRWYILCGLRG